MNLDIQYKIKSDANLMKFLRENSYWYKYLNRSSKNFPSFNQNMKDMYALNPSDRFNKMIDNILMLQNFLNMVQ